MAILNDEKQLSSEPAAGEEKDLGQFPVEAKPNTPTPDQTILQQADLSGCISWSTEDHKEAVDLLLEFADMFSQHDLDMGEISVVEHNIKLEPNSRLIYERYHPIPQSMYKEVRKHLQEMLEVGVIRPLLSLCALVVVLVWKRDGKLQFCINLHRLNNMTLRDAYRLPQIQETLKCLLGGCLNYAPGPKIGLLAGKDGRRVQSIYSLHCQAVGVLQVPTHAIWVNKCTCHLSMLDGDMFGGSSS